MRQAFVERFARALQASPPVDLMMTGAQVQALRRAGMQIGAHTVTHPILKGLPLDAAQREITGSRQHLEGLINERVGLFAYPNGKHGVDFDDAAVALVGRLGFDAAVTTHAGVSRPGGDRFCMPRFTPWEGDSLRFGLRLWQNLGHLAGGRT